MTISFILYHLFPCLNVQYLFPFLPLSLYSERGFKIVEIRFKSYITSINPPPTTSGANSHPCEILVAGWSFGRFNLVMVIP